MTGSRVWYCRLLAVFAITLVAAASTSSVVPGRRIVDLTDGWRFALANPVNITVPPAFASAHLPGYDDSAWRVVDVPHDWSIEQTPAEGPGTSADTGFFPGGLGFYRKQFTVPSALIGKRISIEFDGVYMNSEVYINGQLVGTHPYGYTPFAYDISSLIRADGSTNLVAVKVQNQLPSSRWYSGSGIYRNVRLVATDAIHVARFGTYATTPQLASTISAGYADVNVATDITNELAVTASLAMTYTIRDARDVIVGQTRQAVAAGPGTTRDTAVVRVDHPSLWSPDAPTTYRLETQLTGGGAIDKVLTTIGIRSVQIDPNHGMLINGVATKIHGVDLHHDLGALGAAVHRDAIWREMSIMKTMGVNALRTAHNPPSPELIDVCEQLGIVVMVEAFDTWRNHKVAFDYATWFAAPAPGAGSLLWSDVDIMTMVHAFKSSPAVVMWSIGNEIRGQTVEDATRLVSDIKSIDASRPVVWGSDSYRTPPSRTSVNGRIALLLDGVGLNYNTAQSVDALHALYPAQFIFESESSSSTSSRGVYQWPQQLNTGEDYTPGHRLVSSYDNNMASWTMPGEYGLKKDRDRQFFTGEFLWSGFDYIGEPTPYSQFPVKSSFFGAVDTAGFPKDLFHAFTSQWAGAPMVHLVPMNWTDHAPGELVTVWAYANVDTVELFLNGSSLGVRRYDHKTTTFGAPYLETTEPTGDDKTFASRSYTSPNGSTGKLHLTWSVPFTPGELVAVASQNGTELARDVLRTAGAPHALRLSPDHTVITAERRSLSYVTVEVIDAAGVVVPSAHDVIQFQVDGGVLAGVDSGRQETAEPYQARERAAFNGKALAIVRSDGRVGSIAITASADGLVSDQVTIAKVSNPGAIGKTAAAAASHSAPPGARAAAARRPVATALASSPVTAPLMEATASDAIVAHQNLAPDAVPSASFSGAPSTVPASLNNGIIVDPNGWSNRYLKVATALLPSFSLAQPSDWVSLRWPTVQGLDTLIPYFHLAAGRTFPAAVSVEYWDGQRFVPCANQVVTWATSSDSPTTISFDKVSTTEVRLVMTSAAPGTSDGFVQISELQALGDRP
jgi:beta-galactosidase